MRTTAFVVLLSLLSGPALLANAASAPSVSAIPTPPSRTLSRRTDSSRKGGHLLNPVDVNLKAIKGAPVVPMTNAQRLRRGLSPNRPSFYRSAQSLTARASPIPDPNPGCTTRTGTLLVSGAGVPSGAIVSRIPNDFGEYGITTDAADALQIQYADCGNNQPVDLVTLNGIADFTFFGGITGFASTSPDLDPGSTNYAYIGGVTPTAPRSPPEPAANSFTFATGTQEDIESAIWRVNGADGAVTAQWFNFDGGMPATDIVYYEPEDFLLLSGDAAAFGAEYGASGVVALTFVQV
ncbi:uncharacterized protein C8Q71DRAFT_741867 [Rhodofomes roseus]|uniref:Uncharacterized protein n=1 Tax=Rhodofomes roseus TaxID=34475 RepID=A0ABQ8KQF3_9APHY|nr:uncharacterized protein C8Q71DRAFT_741867 [Rhodofomes roseus]KAH9840863.1 hypothetical protein C8Q71DRAFT_741867 [Rhodofomes roseus]